MTWHAHKVNSGERDYESQRKAAEAMAANPYQAGIQDPNMGRENNFAQPDTVGNIAPKVNSSGDADLGVSATTNPSENPQDFANRKVMDTIRKIAAGEYRNYNDPSQIYG